MLVTNSNQYVNTVHHPYCNIVRNKAHHRLICRWAKMKWGLVLYWLSKYEPMNQIALIRWDSMDLVASNPTWFKLPKLGNRLVQSRKVVHSLRVSQKSRGRFDCYRHRSETGVEFWVWNVSLYYSKVEAPCNLLCRIHCFRRFNHIFRYKGE